MNSDYEFNYKEIVKTFRIILETLRRRVWIIWMIIQGIMQVLGQKKYKRIIKRKEKHEKKGKQIKWKILAKVKDDHWLRQVDKILDNYWLELLR